MDQENLGPADRLIATLLNHSDHMVHNRPGMVVADARHAIGVRWEPVTHKVNEEGKKVVYKLTKVGKKTEKTEVGQLWADNTVRNARTKVADYRPAGLFPEVAEWMYRQCVEVWKLDNEFAARWASHSFVGEHRDIKVVLAALMLVQSRKGDPEKDEDGSVLYDDDYRDVGEAMVLRGDKGARLDPKLLLRIHDFLSLDGIAAINRELGFGKSTRRPFYGRWEKAVTKWLLYREENPKMLAGLVKAGFRQSVMRLARKVGYKPSTDKFFELLRWKQAQAKDGRRELAIGKEVEAAETWEGLTEEEICVRIVETKPNYKRIVGLVPSSVGLTRAIVAAAIEAGGMSDKDLIIATPTLEDLGLLTVQEVKERWEKALKAAEDQRATNIASRVKNKATKEKLEEAADTAVQKAVEEVVKDVRVYIFVDVSSSMQQAIVEAKKYIEKFVQAFPLDQLHVAIFNTRGTEVIIKSATERDGKSYGSAATVRQAFRGKNAGGGTEYGAGVMALRHHAPKPEEDVVFIFVGDEEAHNFAPYVEPSGLRPMAFGLVRVGNSRYKCVQETAVTLNIPCFMISEETFADPYAIPRTMQALISATPVGVVRAPNRPAARRVSLAETISKTELLQKPVWAA